MTKASQLLLTFLANAAWQVALIYAAARACSWLLRSTSARYRHLLWVVALSAAIILPVVTSLDFERSDYATPQSQYESPPVTMTVDQSVATAGGPLIASPVHLSLGEQAAMILLALYLLIMFYRCIKLLRAWQRARAIARDSSPAELPEGVAAIVDECRGTLGVGAFRIHQSHSIPTPVTVGVFDPIVILPGEALRGADSAMVRSAVGHELVHILRRDYLLNLLYEVASIPLSLHPAAALIRRYIRRTRELRCDEIVTQRLVNAETYARALLQLANAAVPSTDPARSLTVGITDADILEERVMTMLKKNSTSRRRVGMLIVLASVLLAIPCAAAARMAFRISVGRNATGEVADGRAVLIASTPGKVVRILLQVGDGVEAQQGVLVVEAMKMQNEVSSPKAGRVAEMRVREGQTVNAGEVLAVIVPEPQESQQRSEQEKKQEEELKAQERQARELAEQEQKRQERMARELQERQIREQNLNEKARSEQQLEEERLIKMDAEAREKAEAQEKARSETYLFRVEGNKEEMEARRRAELQERARRQSELAKQVKVSMDQAVQLASNQQAGKVVECNLMKEMNEVMYRVVIVNGAEPERVYVFLSGMDGRILKIEHEK
jgi:beta-lactamase regulating signal transducer with metallopeptidase domain/uncharacterized membrane protein YkoI